MDMEVRHDGRKNRFVADVEDRECVLDYERVDDDTLDFKHTFTPRPLRHRGIASEVVRQAFEWVDRNDQQVIATCPFVQKYVERHPEVRERVTEAA